MARGEKREELEGGRSKKHRMRAEDFCWRDTGSGPSHCQCELVGSDCVWRTTVHGVC